MESGRDFQLAARHFQSGRHAEAEEICRELLARNQNDVEALNLLGILLARRGEWGPAIEFYQRAIGLRPDVAEIIRNRGNAQVQLGQFEAAIESYRRVIQLRPDYFEVLFDLGNVLTRHGRFDEAIAAYRQAIALRPDSAETLSNLGNALREKGELDEAFAACRRATAIRPDFSDAYNNLGTVLEDKGEMDGAIAAFRRAISLRPSSAKFHWNLARALLASGRLEEGWEEFEWRLRVGWMKLDRGFSQPAWNGEAIADRTLLIHTEGGFGDALNFVRLVPLVSGRAGKVILECQPELLRLFGQVAGVDQIIGRGESLPAFDFRIAFQSLPRMLGLRLETIPNSVPYLRAPGEIADHWRGRLHRDGKINVGLCWAGSRGDMKARTRTIDVYSRLGRISGARFFSLQKSPEGNQKPPEEMELIDYTGELNDFADMAGLTENLDLVISVDTSIAHLAGALGKPVWVLIPHRSDFRWLMDREDSPWYPTMRLFRQKRGGNWDEVAERIGRALETRVGEMG